MEQKNRDKKVNLLGVYNYTVWLTYFGLFHSGDDGGAAWEADKGDILFGNFRPVRCL